MFDKRQSCIIIALVLVIVLSSTLTGCLIEKEKYILSPATNSGDNSKESGKIEDRTQEEIVVHIKGEVKMPGIYKMPKEPRLYELVEAAGGLTERADIKKINLAIILEDQEAVYIPAIGEEVAEEKGKKVSNSNSSEDGKVRINYASKDELKELQGIGDAIADRIIEYRNTSGGFKSIEEIKNVSGIGDKKFEDIKNRITVD